MEALLTPTAVAERLGLTPKTVREYIRTGRLEAIDLNPKGKRPTWRIRPESLPGSDVEEIFLDVKRKFGL
jgi:predicted site-specific integrase-resolvase